MDQQGEDDEQQARNTSLKMALAAITKSRPKEKFELVWQGRKIVKDKGPNEITVFVQDEWGLEGKWSDFLCFFTKDPQFKALVSVYSLHRRRRQDREKTGQHKQQAETPTSTPSTHTTAG